MDYNITILRGKKNPFFIHYNPGGGGSGGGGFRWGACGFRWVVCGFRFGGGGGGYVGSGRGVCGFRCVCVGGVQAGVVQVGFSVGGGEQRGKC